MQILTLHVEESFVQTLKEFIAKFPKDKVSIKEDLLATELKKRIQEIDDGKIEMTPYADGMNEMMDRIKQKYARC